MTTPKPRPSRPRIALTMGDPAGVGPELCLRVLKAPEVLDECIPVIFGDVEVLWRVAKACGLESPRRVLEVGDVTSCANIAEPAVVNCRAIRAEKVTPGRVSPECGRAAYTYIESGIQAALTRKVAAVVTAPINKEALRAAGIPYPGHTEIFTALTGARRSCMMLAGRDLAVSFVTVHVGYYEVPKLLSRQRILDVIELTAEALHRVRRGPVRIAVCGLNPHAGEHGLFGEGEEERYIEPAVAAAQARGIQVAGPLPPDTVFVPSKRVEFGAIVCMYHDQGHIPFKMLHFDTGVNVTLGLPIVRTSVDHGTAFDIAWTGKASSTSLQEAIHWAVRLASHRAQ